MANRPDYPSNDWPGIERLLSDGGEPKPADLIKAVKRTTSIPKRARAYLVACLDGSVKKRGRPVIPLGMGHTEYERRKAYSAFFHPIRLIREVTTLSMHWSQYPNTFVPPAMAKQLHPKTVLELQTAKSPEQKAIILIAAGRDVDTSTVRRRYNKACAQHPWFMAMLNPTPHGVSRD